MAFHNNNYSAVLLNTGTTYTQAILGNGITASTVHEVYCLTNGSINITAFGGGAFTATMTAGQSLKVLCGRVVVNSGSFVGFRAKHEKGPRLVIS